MVGTALVRSCTASGDDVVRLVRERPRPDAKNEVYWSPSEGEIDVASLGHIDAAVHLAGASIAGGRWTRSRKALIRNSRVNGTRLISQTLANMDPRPGVLVSPSAAEYYGDRGNEPLTEESERGEGFLPEVAELWETSAQPARDAGIRVVHTRFGLILDSSGGALAKMQLPFKTGLGAKMGGGRQWWPWIALDDVVGVIRFAITNGSLEGPVNTVAPGLVRNAQFTEALARALSRPAFLSAPGFVLKLAMGQMAEEILLSSQRVLPDKLEEAGYEFLYPQLDAALEHVLRRRDEDA